MNILTLNSHQSSGSETMNQAELNSDETVPVEGNQRYVDANEIRTLQFLTVAVVVSGFVFERWELIAFQFIVFALGFISAFKFEPYAIIYKYLLLPSRILKKDMRIDNIEAYHFATIMGTFVSASATYFLATGNHQVGWTIVMVMITLGSLGFAGWCIACFFYYLLQRTGIKGFFRYPPLANTYPGFRGPRV